jgi:flagellar biosynthesis protein FlhG
MFEQAKSSERISVNTRTIRRHSTKLSDRFHGWQAGLSPGVTVPNGEVPTIIATGGGKGGVGKSIFSANLSSRLGQMGYRVLAIDLDLGCTNLHTHFGISMPKKTMAEFVISKTMNFADIIHQSAVSNVGVIPGGREDLWAQFFEGDDFDISQIWNSILGARKSLDIDFVVLDLGAGTSRLTLDFFNAAHLGVVTVLPEPTSIENAYVFIKTMMIELLNNIGMRLNAEDEVQEIRSALMSAGGSLSNSYADCLRTMSQSYPELIGLMFSAMRGRNLGIIVNQSRSQNDIDIGTSMNQICRQYFGLQADFLGYLNYDDTAWKSLRNRRLLTVDFPHCLLAKRITKVALNSLALLGYYGGS